MDSVQKSSEIRNFCTEFLLFAYLAKIKHFYNTKLPAFVFFFADIGVLNTRKFVGIEMIYEKFRSELSDEQSNFIENYMEIVDHAHFQEEQKQNKEEISFTSAS